MIDITFTTGEHLVSKSIYKLMGLDKAPPSTEMLNHIIFRYEEQKGTIMYMYEMSFGEHFTENGIEFVHDSYYALWDVILKQCVWYHEFNEELQKQHIQNEMQSTRIIN